MPDALLTLLRWCLLALLYLFFFRVLQATWQSSLTATPGQVRDRRGRRRKAVAPQPAPAPVVTGAAPAPLPVMVQHMVAIAPPEAVGVNFAIGGGLTIGRAAGCEVTLDDTFISQLHARISVGESGVVVEDLGSTNGTYVNRTRVTAPVVVVPGDQIQVGNTIMEFR